MTYFPLHGPNHLQLNFYRYCKILNVVWTLIASKKRIEQLNCFDWLSNLKSLVFSNGCEHVRNVIQWD